MIDRKRIIASLAGSALLCALAPGIGAQADDASSAKAEDLRSRIREMRMSLLLGGDQVQKAEAEAVDFYERRIEMIDSRADTVHSDLAEKRATYNVALDRALGAPDPDARAAAMKQAQTMSNEVSSLEREAEDLQGKRKSVSGLVRAVEDRGRQREDLAARLEVSADVGADLGISIGGVGLAPNVEVQPAGSPLDDSRLVQDLLERDPRAARRLLFESDPTRYWQRFPMRPPADLLSRALPFPLPDLPGKR